MTYTKTIYDISDIDIEENLYKSTCEIQINEDIFDTLLHADIFSKETYSVFDTHNGKSIINNLDAEQLKKWLTENTNLQQGIKK